MRPLTTYELDNLETHIHTITEHCSFFLEDSLRRQMMQDFPTPFRLLIRLQNRVKAEFRKLLTT